MHFAAARDSAQHGGRALWPRPLFTFSKRARAHVMGTGERGKWGLIGSGGGGEGDFGGMRGLFFFLEPALFESDAKFTEGPRGGFKKGEGSA